MGNYLDFTNEKDYTKLIKPAEIIKNGGIVVFPTETVYGIGTNGLDENAIRKLYEVKERPLNKPINLLVSSIDMIKSVTKDITELEYFLIKEFFPGPLTIILKKKSIVPDILTAGNDTIGIRMPNQEIALRLIEYAGVPIATPSANISGNPSGIEMKKIMEEFKEKVDCYIDGGKSKIGLASTIIQVVNDVPIILREGSISKQQIMEKIKDKKKFT